MMQRNGCLSPKQIWEWQNISRRKAMDVYYKSRLSEQVQAGQYGIENLDYKYLAEDLIENEPELFAD